MAALTAAVASVVLAAGALAAARVLGRAGDRYRLLAVAFIVVALIGPAALAAAALRPAAASGSGGSGGAFERLAVPLLALGISFAAALLFELVLDVVRLRRIKRAATPIGTVAIRRACIGTSPTVPTPTAIGYLHPAIVVPDGFRDRVDAGEWEAVVAHECAHLARGDDWAKALQSAVLRAAWWLPGLWLLSRSLDLERELASDEKAAGTTGARRYAACLLRLATGGCTDAVAPGLWGRRAHVAIRVERLLRPAVDASPVLRAAVLGAFTATAIGVVCAAFASVPAIGRHSTAAVRPVRLSAALPARRPHAVAATHVAHRAPRATARPARVAFVPSPPSAAEPAVRAVAAPVARPKASRRIAARPAPAGASTAAPDVVVVAVLPHVRCATCFGPLRAPDSTFSPPASTATPAPGASVGSTSVAAEDTGSGSASTNAGFLWLRMPRALILP